jgi:hemolysin D
MANHLGCGLPGHLRLAAQTHPEVDGKTLSLTPGMNLTAEIKTGERRVIEYLLRPVQRAGQESLWER